MTDLLPGETYLSDTPVLAAHAGTQPDLFLRWNRIPQAATSVDVIVFLHGFSQSGGAMPLSARLLEAAWLIVPNSTFEPVVKHHSCLDGLWLFEPRCGMDSSSGDTAIPVRDSLGR